MSSKWTDDPDDDDDSDIKITAPDPIQRSSPPAAVEDKPSRRPRRRRSRDEEQSPAGGEPKDAEMLRHGSSGGGKATADDKDSPPPTKKMEGGWSLEGPSSAAGAGATSGATGRARDGGTASKPQEATGGRRGRRSVEEDETTEILVIPDLDDDGTAEDMTVTVAVAPKNITRRLPSLRELDHEIKYTVPSAAEGLDMSLLTRTLVPPEMLHEKDVTWTFDSLLQEVTQEYNAEMHLTGDKPKPVEQDRSKTTALGTQPRGAHSRANGAR